MKMTHRIRKANRKSVFLIGTVMICRNLLEITFAPRIIYVWMTVLEMFIETDEFSIDFYNVMKELRPRNRFIYIYL